MSVLIVGSTALDSIKTPKAENPRLLGGSASHAAVAASFFGPVKLVGVVGDDFPKRYIQLYKRHGIDLEGLQMLPGKTFHWSGEYEANMNNRRTLHDRAGRVRDVHPDAARGVSDRAVRAAGQHRPGAAAPCAGPDAAAQVRRRRHDGFVAQRGLAGFAEAAEASGRLRAQ